MIKFIWHCMLIFLNDIAHSALVSSPMMAPSMCDFKMKLILLSYKLNIQRGFGLTIKKTKIPINAH